MSGQGTLYQRKGNSKWYLIVNLGTKNEQGKYEQKWIDLETTDKNIAKEKRKLVLADIQRKGRYDEPSKQTFGEWLDFWLNEIARPKVRPNTYDDYEYLIRIHIKPELGGYPIRKITPELLLVFYNKKRKEKRLSKKVNTKGERIPSEELLSSRTVQKIQIVINASLQKAAEMRKIPENPSAVIEKVAYKRPKVKYMLSDKAADFLDKISDDRWYAAFVTDLGTGLRIGELLALKWPMIDLKKGTITVEEAITSIQSHQKEGPKTILNKQDPKSEKGFRTVPLPIDVIEVLKKWRVQQKKEKMKAGKYYHYNEDLVFTWEDGRPVRPDYLSKHFLKLVRKYDFDKGLTFHKLRHSYASILLEKGEDMKTIQENLGDSSLSIVADTYTHVADKLKERAARKLDGFTKKKAR